jgi:putative spermidine/putrescine transport system ATP-binding protein
LPADDVVVMIRPERLRLRGLGPAAENELELVVEDTINYGDSILVIGRTHGVAVRARLIGGDPDALRRGSTVQLGWAGEDAHILAQ